MALGRRKFLGAAGLGAGLGLGTGNRADAAPQPIPARQLPITGLISNPSSLRSVYPISPYEARGAAYLPGSNVLRLATGEVHFVPVGSPWDAYRAGPDADAMRAADADRAWLAAGDVPGSGKAERELAERALLDMRSLTRPGGAQVPAWYTFWQFVWPRDGSWAIAAFAATGHGAEAFAVLSFLAKAQHADGTWDARYHPIDASPVADGRRWQLDGCGWVPWATWFWYVSQPGEPQDQLTALWPMVDRAAGYVAGSLDADGLPPVSPDYWETTEEYVTIGTVAPLRTGLRSAAALASILGKDAEHARYARAADLLDGAIRRYFAPAGYPRSTKPGSGADVAVTFLAPPFGPADPGVLAAVQTTAGKLVLPTGGVLPGEDWPGDPDQAWTAETCWFALALAASGHIKDSDPWLQWVADHRTELGAIPEKVDAAGLPNSVAPFSWTAAAVLLTLTARGGRLLAPPVP